jgi:hypothetical protein
MTVTDTNVSLVSATGLPKELLTAQEAIHFPEVQEMLRKLSKYNLGIFMPHMHEDETGRFQSLPDGLVQVEDGLRVSFCKEEAIKDSNSYVPIGWVWRENASVSSARCVMRCIKRDGDTMHYSGHVKE